ncbi:MAG: tetratricopeptide repeat protein [Nitrospinota bacterium]|nr:tetratricopeptide repeat protein [Nitrospinota bacterium]
MKSAEQVFERLGEYIAAGCSVIVFALWLNNVTHVADDAETMDYLLWLGWLLSALFFIFHLWCIRALILARSDTDFMVPLLGIILTQDRHVNQALQYVSDGLRVESYILYPFGVMFGVFIDIVGRLDDPAGPIVFLSAVALGVILLTVAAIELYRWKRKHFIQGEKDAIAAEAPIRAVYDRDEGIQVLKELAMKEDELFRDYSQGKPEWTGGADDMVELGEALRRMEMLDASVDVLTKVVEAAPDLAMAHSVLGESLSLSGKYDQAIAACCKSVELAPDVGLFHCRLANAYFDNKMFQEAEREYRQVLILSPDDFWAVSYLGRTLYYQDKPQDAIMYLYKALEMDPDELETNYFLGASMAELNQHGRAIPYFETALANGVDLAMTYYQLGRSLLILGNLDEAMTYLENALEFDPDHYWAYLHIALIHMDTNNSKEARQAFEMALEINPEFVEGGYYFAGFLRGEKDYKGALKAYERCLKYATLEQEETIQRAKTEMQELKEEMANQ